jgi:hypothetical protein
MRPEWQWFGVNIGDVIGFGILAVVSAATIYLATRKKTVKGR